jgi:hypothetical protein
MRCALEFFEGRTSVLEYMTKEEEKGFFLPT